jgi:hypothetical protein
VDHVDHQEYPENVPGSKATEEACSEGGGSITDIRILRTPAFHNLLPSGLVTVTLVLRVGACAGLLGATVEGITGGERVRPQQLDVRARNSGGRWGRRVYKHCVQ